MKRFLKVIAFALGGMILTGVIHPVPAAADEITVTSWGGAYSMSQREAYHKPYSQETGITVLEDEWGGELAAIRVQVDTGNYKWHVMLDATSTVLAGCDEGILEQIDYDKLGGRDQFLPGSTLDCGVPTDSYATIYAYDGDHYPESGPRPATMADFFDLKKFPGKRGLYKSPEGNLEIALIAEGVPTNKVAEMLASEGGVDRALAKLDTIKDQVIWWETGAQAPQLLADGEVVMTTAWNGRIYDAVANEGKNFVSVWDGQRLDYEYWMIPKGHPEKDKALDFIAFASRPEVMANQSKYISYGPTTKAALKLINPDILPHLPTAPENKKNSFRRDTQWWADHGEVLRERFSVWLTQ